MRIIILIVICILEIACSSRNLVPKGFKSYIVDTLSHKRMQMLSSALNLSEISEGVDSLELRIWSVSGSTDLDFVTILKFNDSNWHLTETRYWTSLSDCCSASEVFILDSAISKKLIPNIEIKGLLDSLEYFSLETIPDQHTIPGFRDKTADGTYYTLEYATKSSYKMISYHNPNWYQDSIHRKVSAMLSCFGRNLNVFGME